MPRVCHTRWLLSPNRVDGRTGRGVDETRLDASHTSRSSMRCLLLGVASPVGLRWSVSRTLSRRCMRYGVTAWISVYRRSDVSPRCDLHRGHRTDSISGLHWRNLGTQTHVSPTH